MSSPRSRLSPSWLLFFLALLLWGCPSNPQENNPQGPCTLGELACACASGDVCNQDASGRQLACVQGVCGRTPCAPGEVGCSCDAGSCNAGLECSDASGIQRCEVAGCVIGATNCGCGLDRACAAGSSCQLGVCTPRTCTPGDVGCACSERFTCARGLRCDLSADTCESPASCTPGNLGCACDEGDGCVGALACTGDVCLDPSCVPGQEWCPCGEGDSCEVGGKALVCSAGLCKAAQCEPGETGCTCKLGRECDAAGDACAQGLCRPTTCIAGEENCECLAGSCDPGLVCKNDEICLKNTGERGGPCFADGTCGANLKCDGSILPAACVFCDLGSLACQCTSDGSCNPGLSCLGATNHCVSEETVRDRTPPEDPACVTPCEDSVVTEDEEIACINGFLEGCLGDLMCVSGSCIAPGSQTKTCHQDSECPEFQLCIHGSCYTECNAASDCALEGERAVCHKRVCRQSCSMEETRSTCPGGLVCDDSTDGVTGYCMPRGASSGQPTAPKGGGLEVSKTLIEFTNTKISETLTLKNTSENYLTVTMRKVEHDVLFTDNSRDKRIDYEPISECSGLSCPLYWLETGEFGAITQDRTITVRVPPRCTDDCPVVTLRVANNGAAIDAVRWRGVMEIHSEVGAQRLDLSYVSSPQGRWVGQMFYYANFETEGIDSRPGFMGWLDRADKKDVTDVRNGLIQRWGAFRNGSLTQGWTEMRAVLNATQTGQWKFPSVVEDCIVPEGACYLLDGGTGALPRDYVAVLDETPIPDGVVEFPMALNLYIPDRNSAPETLEGRIVSESALHYSGDPKVRMTFQADPTDTANCNANITDGTCVNIIQDMDIKVTVGGRYETTSSSCSPGFRKQEYPWLVPGFLQGTVLNPNTGRFRKNLCVDERLPFFGSTEPKDITTNLNLAASNPIPNGAPLERTIEFLDGAMIDQTEMFILFRESIPSFLGNGENMVAYGYMLLERQPVQIDPEDDDGDGVPDAYEGSDPPQGLAPGAATNQVQCSRELLDQALGVRVALTSANAPTAIRALINGGEPSSVDRISWPEDLEEVHYLCEETGLFDGGPGNTSDWTEGGIGPNDDSCVTSANGICEDGGLRSAASTCDIGTDVIDCGLRYQDVRVSCPRKSNVIYFTTDPVRLPNIAGLPCQQDGTCLDTLNLLISTNNPILKQIEPKWTCTGDQIFCDDNELDRREGKRFFQANSANIPFLSLRSEIEDAFRYKTRFRARDNSVVGFAPVICEPFSTTTPYCYDPDKIEALRERVDCLLDVYDQHYDTQATSGRPEADLLYTYLEENFGVREEPRPQGGLPRTFDGFERLYSELLIMLGDDAYTKAFESRFDLAGSLAASFPGSELEEGGIDLSGIAGFEMFQLYQAVQYYDLVLSRFYAMGDVFGATLRSGPTATQRNFITAATVTQYFDRLIRASTQRSRALSEIAKRYQSFNRANLASRVAARAYTGTYLESVVLANLIVRLYDEAGGSERPELLRALEQSQLRYRMALLDLANVNEAISKEINFFGYPADYIPFPALDSSTTVTAESNAFEKILKSTLNKLDQARTWEQRALETTRSYNTDTASFQAELTRISRTYENQLIDICGTIEDANKNPRPAVERYAFLDEELSLVGDPCGLVGAGTLHNALGTIRLRQLEVRQQATQIQNTFEEMEIERKLASDQCDIQLENRDFQLEFAQDTFNLEEEKVRIQENVDRVTRAMETVQAGVQVISGGGGPFTIAGGLGTLTLAAAGSEIAISIAQARQREKRRDRQELEKGRLGWDGAFQCKQLNASRDAMMARLVLRVRDQELSLLASEYQVQLALAEIRRLRQLAKRIEQELEESLQLAINVEAAKNNPNIRIYRNDSVINAEDTFEVALREAYRLTLVYEYYTSTTYALRDQLFLIRMVSAGEYNLENYVADLRTEFNRFEEEFGIPDTRLEILSLMDDILQVPRLDEEGQPLSVTAREALMRQKLLDPGMLNGRGFISLPFRTSVERLSPLTRNHKVLNLEANIIVGGNPDFLGRLYVRQVGTSVIRTVEDDSTFYRFPELTAVVDPFFNSSRQLKDSGVDIYKNFRLRDRPLVNTNWELVINQRSEFVNQDINLNELSDIILYIYYTDFTVY